MRKITLRSGGRKMKDTRDMMVKDYDTCTDEELIARLRAGEREITDYMIDK